MVNEKTLELNISTEFLNHCRKYDQHAFLFGTTLKQESQFGYDSRVLGRLPPFWRIAVFQFKKPYRKRKTRLGEEYTFNINNNTYKDQHILLYLMSGGRSRVALYVFPLYVTLQQIRNSSPYLLRRTLFADVRDIPPWLVDNRSHKVLVYPKLQIGIVKSEEWKIQLFSFEELLKDVSKKKMGIPVSMLLENLKSKEKWKVKLGSKRPRFTFQVFTR